MSEDTKPLLVTIQCFTYNQEPYIRQCLDGFVMQKTNFRFEAIVHDDASTDGTAAIIREYAEKYPDIVKPIFEIENQYSKGGGFALLQKIMNEHTHGKYVAFCEGDDYWTNPYKLQKQVDFLEANLNYSMCFHQAQIKNEIGKKRIFIVCENIEDREYDPNELLKTWTVPTASICAKREILDVKNTGVERIVYGDIIHILNCAKIGKIWGISDRMSVYRIQAKGVTNDKTIMNSDTLKLVDHYKFIKDNYPFIKKSIISKKISRAYLNRRHCQTNHYKRIKDILCALYYYPFIFWQRIEFAMNNC